MSLLDDVLERYRFSDVIAEFSLETPRGKNWRCPFPEGHNHEDSNPSASISTGKDGRERWGCFACGRWGSSVNLYADLTGVAFVEALRRIASSLGLVRERFQPITARPQVSAHVAKQKQTPTSDKPLGQEVKAYDYRDGEGVLLYQVVRYDPKDFRQRRPNPEGGWSWSLKGTRRVLYRLPQVIEAINAGKSVWIAEGEKDADTLTALGYCGTTVPGGAGKWREEYAALLVGADVVIVCDNDDAGRSHGEALHSALQGSARNLWVLTPAEGKDVTEMLARGLPVTALREVS